MSSNNQIIKPSEVIDKICIRCKTRQDINNFVSYKKHCKECINKEQHKYSKINNSNYYKKNKDKLQKINLQNYYIRKNKNV